MSTEREKKGERESFYKFWFIFILSRVCIQAVSFVYFAIVYTAFCVLHSLGDIIRCFVAHFSCFIRPDPHRSKVMEALDLNIVCAHS